jgi:arginyl-tRNA synthetase
LSIKEVVHSQIKSILDKDVILQKPKDLSLGHFATPVAFSLAKELKKAPNIIAQELSQTLEESEIFDSVTAVNGFINIKLSNAFFDKIVDDSLALDTNFAQSSHNEKILLEFVSANPTGPLHIGHARGAILGDAILKIGKYLGYDIDSEYYINDAGNQIKLLGVSVLYIYQTEVLKQDIKEPEEFYRGEYILDLVKEILSENGEEIFNEESIETLSDISKVKMMNLIKQNLQMANIEFDYFVNEKPLYSRWDYIEKKLHENDALYEKDGKLWLKSTAHKDELDRVVVRENGIPTYLAGDIIYHEDKYRRDYDKYINIWGADHHGYIKRVKSSIKYLGNDEKKLEIILSQMVALLKDGQPYKMSKRAGNFILMSDIIEEIGQDALRYVFLSKKPDTHLEFDIEDLKKQDSSNPIFYINYAYARINSLFEKASVSKEDVKNIKIENIDENLKSLLFNSLMLTQVLEDSFDNRAIQKLTEYLNELASMFHSYYNNNKIIGTKNQNEVLKVLLMVSLTIKTALSIVGISIKDKM